MATQSNQCSKPSISKLRWVTAAIRRFLLPLVEGAIFSTRELLALGSRSAIDSALSRLAASGAIIRLTAGLYMKIKASAPDWRPSTEAVVHAKLLAFRRSGVPAADIESSTRPQFSASDSRSKDNAQSSAESAPSNASNAVAQNAIAAQNYQQTIVYEITGNKSRFRLFNGIVVHVKSISNRKLDLAQSVVGTKLKNLWQRIDRLCQDETHAFLRGLGREEKADVKALLPLLPQKMSDWLGAPWNHRQEMVQVSSTRNDGPEPGIVEWFSLSAISQSRGLRTMKRPPPLLELNF